ncbi:hypothetical protein [Corynebacterium cystitidis]|uniref:hypothetical protein n=1 Tax=Corynebacterium cystitidis TaxID=35757 RepID=UPI00211E820E|nr:hypothetical protein [Corynebacterium cystitidis]
MSNATYRSGAISYPIAQDIEQFSLVAINGEGKLVPASAAGAVFGVVTEPGSLDPRAEGNDILAVSYGQNGAKIRTDDEIKAGAAVFAAADGKAAASGSVQVGVAVRDTKNGVVVTILNKLPYAPGA